MISNGYLAGVVLVVCKTDPSAGAKGTSILIAETEGLEGYRVGRVLDKIGMKAQDTAELFFDEVALHRDQLLGGKEGQGFYQLMGDLPYERLIISVNAVGAIEGALAATIDYAKERRAFGHSVFEFQNSKFKLAEIATQARVARSYLDRCIQNLLAGRLDTVGASMAKLCLDHRIARPRHRRVLAVGRRLWLYQRIHDRTHVRGCAGAAYLWRHQRNHEGSDLALVVQCFQNGDKQPDKNRGDTVWQ